MLKITRHVQESVQIDTECTIRVMAISGNRTRLEVADAYNSVVFTYYVGDSFDVGECKVTVLACLGTIVRLGFEAPSHVSIMRTELVQTPKLPPAFNSQLT